MCIAYDLNYCSYALFSLKKLMFFSLGNKRFSIMGTAEDIVNYSFSFSINFGSPRARPTLVYKRNRYLFLVSINHSIDVF